MAAPVPGRRAMRGICERPIVAFTAKRGMNGGLAAEAPFGFYKVAQLQDSFMTASNAYADAPREDGFFSKTLAESDPELFGAIESELHRQQNEIELIASENIVSRAVLEAAGSVLTNKYAEGYPAKRYYGGCQYVDIAENLAIERAKRLFNCGFANVQPHSGSQANQGVMLALAKPGDKILGMSLDAGGHLTHGAAPNLSGKWFEAIQYGVRKR